MGQLFQLAKEFNAGVADIFNKWAQVPSWHKLYLLPDFLHLSEAGNIAIHGEIMAALKQHMPSMLPRNMPIIFPPQPVIDLNHPEWAFVPVLQSSQAERSQLAAKCG